MDNALDRIARHAEAGAVLRTAFFSAQGGRVDEAARHMAVCLARGGKILLAGNGGSAADAQHWAGEFVNRFIMDRPPLPAVALSTDTSVLTAIGNDFGYEFVFSKQIQALARPGDVFIAISTSGNSANLVEALRAARRQNVFTIGLTGEGGGAMAPLCDLLLAVPVGLLRDGEHGTGGVDAASASNAPGSTGVAGAGGAANVAGGAAVSGGEPARKPGASLMITPLVQEVHEAIGHLLCSLVDHYLFENVMAIKPMLDEPEK